MPYRKSPRLPGGNKYRWTAHVERKMRFYGLSPARVLRIMNAPERVEEGVAPGTIAGMQKVGTKAKPREVWAMWRAEQRTKPLPKGMSGRTVIITAWRYPGMSPIRGPVPLPDDVRAELDAEGLLEG